MGLFGLGLGAALGYVEFRHAQAPVVWWLLMALSYYLVYRLGRRGRAGASATAVALAEASADAQAVATSAVNVFIAPPGMSRIDELERVSWRDADSDRSIDAAKAAQIAGDSLPDHALDLVDVRDIADLQRRGEIADE